MVSSENRQTVNINIFGFLRRYMDEQGLPVSRVEPVRDPDVQQKIKTLIMEIEPVSQVNFR